MELLRQITEVRAGDDCRLFVTFDTGESGTVDMSPLLGFPRYRRLKNSEYFKLARVERGTVVWPNDEDVAPEMLWERHHA